MKLKLGFRSARKEAQLYCVLFEQNTPDLLWNMDTIIILGSGIFSNWLVD